VADCPTFQDVAADWQEFLQGCDLHGYNAKKFDLPLLGVSVSARQRHLFLGRKLLCGACWTWSSVVLHGHS